MDCIFCKIISGEIPSPHVYEDENMVVVRDIDPKAPKHYLCLPREHYATLEEMNEKQAETLGKCLKKISSLQKELGLTDGYRLVINQGADAGQTVFHLHIHILAGQKMGWTPA